MIVLFLIRNPVQVQTKITPSISNNYSLNAFLDIENIKFTQKEEAIYMYIYFDITNRYNIDYDCSENEEPGSGYFKI